MCRLPVHDLFATVGELQGREESLYLSYDARIQTDREGFLRLYYSQNGQITRLGLFYPEGDSLVCRGRISLRSLGADWREGTFTIRNVPFCPLKTPLHGGNLPESAILLEEKGRRFVVISHENSLPEEIMPYFCFLAPMEIDGTKCLGFEVDLRGKPVLPEFIL